MTSTHPFHRIQWTPAPLSEEPIQFTKVVFVVGGSETTKSQSQQIAAYQTELIELGYTTAIITSHTELHDVLAPETATAIIHIPDVAHSRDGVYSAAVSSCASLITIAQALVSIQAAEIGNATSFKLFSLVANDAGIGELGYAPLRGLARVMKMEVPDLFGGLVELNDSVGFPLSTIKYARGFDIVRVCGDENEGVPQTASLQPLLSQDGGGEERLPVAFDSESAYLITGGTKGIGLETASWMVEHGARHLILVSRHGVDCATASTSASRIAEMEAQGATVHILAIDLSLPGTDLTLRDEIDRLQCPPVKGVVHAAGTAGYHTLKACTPADIDNVFAPKVRGALSLDALFPPGTLDFFLLVSSIGQLVGFPGQLSYAPANAFLDGLATQRRREGDNCTSVQWTTWRGVGLSVQSKSATRMINKGMRERGIADISREEALEAWGHILTLQTDQVAVVRALELDANEPLRHPMLKDITPRRKQREYSDYPKHAVAVVAMACRTAAGDTPDELWKAIQKGQSTVREIDAERFPEASSRTKNPLLGHFLPDIKSFDHKFFGRSKRDAAAMDPHQRLMLETTYHALEAAGWAGGEQLAPETHDSTTSGHITGCFVGMNAPDYILNLGSQPPSPYTGGGMMRSFVAGRVSHHFGWTGPSQTIDTACSSAMVAIHQACRALQVGECTRAIAGGVNLIPNTVFFDALHAAGFLSETGACKTFDARADGYCRGEAVGVVALKPLDRAVQDGDEIQGVLLATGNNQNMSKTSITNPVLESQCALYQDVLARGGVRPHDVSYVEAHGTGTRAGDPVEVEGIRRVLGGQGRRSVLRIGGVKPNVGHSEAAAGVISLIKVLLMLKHGKIPPQAQFKTLNPNIAALEPDQMAIATSLGDWSDGLRLAMVNSFGASGSNAAAVVAPPPARPSTGLARQLELEHVSEWPVFVSAASESSLKAYCVKLQEYIGNKANDITLPRLAFALATKGNGRFQHRFCSTARSLDDLHSQLDDFETHSSESKSKPIVLLFSGQNGNNTPAVKSLYESSLLFRSRLHQCEEVMLALGLPSMIPTVLNTGSDGDNDLVLRHAALFSIQYACGMAWLDSGVKPHAICGHSFGEWAALTVSAALTLEAGMRLVTGRASIIQKLWGADTGSMLAIEADLVSSNITPEQHLQSFFDSDAGCKLDIACYNGPNNYVVAGSTQDIEVLAANLRDQKAQSTSNKNKLRFKVLKGMHAYHCHMADSIVDACAELSASIPFQQPTHPFVSCHHPEANESWTWKGPTEDIISRNTRGPVYFGGAMQRIVARLGPSCTFLEAGVGGPIISMAQNALASTEHDHTFVAISGIDLMRSLAAATATLWKINRGVQFWPFHRSQSVNFLTPQGQNVDLPPYQFEKHLHWIEYKASPETERDDGLARSCPHCHKSLDDFPYIVQESPQSQQGSGSTVSFSIDTRSRRYQQLIRGHVVVGNPLCPAGMYLELAAHAVRLLHDGTERDKEVGFEAVEIKAPLGLDTQRRVKCTLSKRQGGSWRFEILSIPKDEKTARPTSHCTGVVYCKKVHNDEDADTAAEATSKWTRMSKVLEDSETEALRGAMVYRTFATMATYSPPYRGLRYIAGKGSECAGEIAMPIDKLDTIAPAPNERVTDALLLDNFMQVAGIFVHSLHAADEDKEGLQGSTSYICTGMEIVRSPNRAGVSQGTKYRAYTQIVKDDGRAVVLDLYAFDSEGQQIVWSAQGLRFTKIPRNSLVKTLAKANPGLLTDTEEPQEQKQEQYVPVHRPQFDNGNGILVGVQEILSHCLDVPLAEVKKEASLEELGSDSLVSAEIMVGISNRFSVDISTNGFAAATDVASLCDLISSQLHGSVPSSDNQSTSHSGPAENKDWQGTVIRVLSNALELETADVDLSSSLEDLGADSLVAPEIISNLKEALGVEVSLADFADTEDVTSLCELVGGALGFTPSDSSSSAQSVDTPCSNIDPASDQESVIKSRDNASPETTSNTHSAKATSMLLYRGNTSQTSSSRNLFLIPGGPGYGTVYNHLGQLLSRTSPSDSICIYALNSPFTTSNPLSTSPGSPHNTIPTVEDLAASYTAEIKRRQPHGPYLIGGYSFGGIVSFEAVRQLLGAGDEVEKLVLLDTPCPSADSSIWMPDALLKYITPVRAASGAGDIALAQEQLRRYRVTKLRDRGRSIPSTILVSARYGVDSTYTRQEDRGFSVPAEQRRITEWVLNDRMEGSLGWEELMGKGNVSVIRADGNHYSMLLPFSKMHEWVQQLVEMLEA